MKLLLFVLFAAFCAGYFVVNREVKKDVQTSIANNMAILGMTEEETKKSLGDPLATKTTKNFFGSEVVMTFGDGNEVTFRRGSKKGGGFEEGNRGGSGDPGRPARCLDVEELQEPARSRSVEITGRKRGVECFVAAVASRRQSIIFPRGGVRRSAR